MLLKRVHSRPQQRREDLVFSAKPEIIRLFLKMLFKYFKIFVSKNTKIKFTFKSGSSENPLICINISVGSPTGLKQI